MPAENAEKAATRGSLDWVREEIVRRLEEGADPDYPGVFVKEMFPDRAIFEDNATGTLASIPWRLDGDHLVLGIAREVTVDYVPARQPLPAASLSGGGVELTGPIVARNARQQIVYGAVLVPGEPDEEGDVLSAEKVEEVAHTWLEEFQLLDRQHDLVVLDASPVESYLTPEDRSVTADGQTLWLPEGTWIMAAKVRDDTVWREIEAGQRTGFSIMGVRRDDFELASTAAKAGDFSHFRHVTLTELGGGDPNGPWVAPLVSIVDSPGVPKAKFFALKAVAQDEKNGNLLDRIRDRVSRLLSGNRAQPTLSETAAKHVAEMPSLARLLHSGER